jgi:CBS domain-containing protein
MSDPLQLIIAESLFISAEAVLYSVRIDDSGGKVRQNPQAALERPRGGRFPEHHQWQGRPPAGRFRFRVAGVFFRLTLPFCSFRRPPGVMYGSSLVPFVAYPLRLLVLLMTPAIWLSSWITRMIGRGKTSDEITAEEIRIMARASLRTGGIKPYQEQAIDRILTLQNKTVEDVMTPRTVIFSLSEHLTLEEARKSAANWEHSRFPVYDRDTEDVVGIVLTKELFIALAEGKKDMRLTELMRPIHFVVETAPIEQGPFGISGIAGTPFRGH